ncbi:MAG: peptide chain release factor 2 [Vicinamibacteria bacterium]|nr:peptide chain release factor 2 [Vicinamibacteria bacterium]
MKDEISELCIELKARAADVRGYLDEAKLTAELAVVDREVTEPGFWNDQRNAQKVQRKRKKIEERLELVRRVTSQEGDVAVLQEWLLGGEPVEADLKTAVQTWQKSIEEAELGHTLGGEHDGANLIFSINAGAGGTESQDWAEMLFRMYQRYCERKGFKVDITDYQKGEEAGIKSVTMFVSGEYAFGTLWVESGVHRLVRISPFDSAARRHTSFAAVFAWPELDDSIEIEVLDKDLRVDTYRSSGAGGQHVNVTDSAVRITHIPTNIVVACQNERSQIRNREVAMKVLKARLFDLEMKKQREKLDAVEAAKMQIAFGSQIRSYVLHPYRMVKDHRTKCETGDVDRVLDGDLDIFIKAALVAKAKGELSKGVSASEE